MSTSASLADFINTHALDAGAIARAAVAFADYQADSLGESGMYATLMSHARSADEVDTMLYQLAGDRAYAEQGALLVLSAAWNHAEAVAPLQRILLDAAEGASAEQVDDNRLATSVLFGMYLLARVGKAPLHEVTWRTPAGTVESTPIDGALTAAALFEAVRDLY